MLEALRAHWPEFLCEFALLGLFLVSAGVFGTLLESPRSPVRRLIGGALVRRALMGLAMGATAMLLLSSPWGMRSGAHLNPAVTLTFWRLGKIASADAAWYAIAQVAGALAGVLLVRAMIGRAFADEPVSWVATRPGARGARVAFVAEAALSFMLMSVVLATTSRPALEPFTVPVVGLLIALFIAFEAPLSGMSMNPARSLGSALPSGSLRGMSVYLLAPALGMLAAAQVHVSAGARVPCAKLDHRGNAPCIFRCER